MSASKKTISKLNKKSRSFCTGCGLIVPRAKPCSCCSNIICEKCEASIQSALIFQLFEIKFNSLPEKCCTGKVICQIHSKLKPSQQMNNFNFFNHLFDKNKIKCATPLCAMKYFCPTCLVNLNYQYCPGCEAEAAKLVKKSNRYCNNCIGIHKKLHWTPNYHCMDNYKHEFLDAVKKTPSEDHRIRWLCDLHVIDFHHS